MIFHNIIIVACNIPPDWSTDYPYQTAEQLRKHNIVICWMLQPIALKDYFLRRTIPRLFYKQRKNLYVYQPIHVIPLRRFSVVARINTWFSVRLLRVISSFIAWKKHAQKRILWVFDPQFVPLYRLMWKNIRVIYDCVDYFPGTTDNQELKNQIRANERSLIKRADLVTAISHSLQEFHKKLRPDIHVVPQGFRSDVFRHPSAYRSVKLPKDKPIIGYIGGMNYRLDFGLLDHLATRSPQFRFVLVGPMQETDSRYFRTVVRPHLTVLFRYPNVLYIPSIAKDQVPGMIKQFTIAMIPYNSRFEINRYCYPMKLFEYFYMGKPVVATPIKELERFSKYVRIGTTETEWSRHINKLLSAPWPSQYKKEQRRFTEENRWERKMGAIMEYISQPDRSKHR